MNGIKVLNFVKNLSTLIPLMHKNSLLGGKVDKDS